MKYNEKIRDSLKKFNVYQYEVADAVGVSEYTLCKHLRKELSTDEEERLLRAIERIAEGKGAK